MTIRICFEPRARVNINDSDVFKFYASKYLADFDVDFAGYISIDTKDKEYGRFEPVWQFLMDSESPDQLSELMYYIGANPMVGYRIHIYQKVGNTTTKLL
jgi:hypothetical protein